MSNLAVPPSIDKLQSRKLSDISAASHQTQQSSASMASQGSSVVIRKPELSKSDLHSNVISYIKENKNDFDADGLFSQRQQQFVTTFGKNYHSSDPPAASTPIEESSPLLSAHEPQFFDDDLRDDDYREEDDYQDDDDDFLPPSPPRSPPRELDPDKLYGLYDFSGPDPSHCSISRDEPVYLINDQDNYWWLVRKLTKDEKIALRSRTADVDSDDEILTDDEDGKVGFVPAECLETFGERLARLNCFKNEELEKSARDLLDSVGEAVDAKEAKKEQQIEPEETIPETRPETRPEPRESRPESRPETVVDQLLDAEKSSSSLGLGSPVMFQNSPNVSALSRSGSILKNGSRPSNINKSVTFEDLNDLVLDENIEDSNSEDIDNDFPEHYYNLPAFEEGPADEEKRSEILSDVFPSETPLVVNKRNNVASDPPFVSPYERQIDDQWQDDSDDSSINHRSPNPKSTSSESQESLARPVKLPLLSPEAQDFHTPQNKSDAKFDSLPLSGDDKIDLFQDDDYKTPVNASFNQDSRNSTPASERLRRSELLDRLTQVTSDIQQELDMDEYDSYYDQGRFKGIESTSESSAPSSRASTHKDGKVHVLTPIDDEDQDENSESELDDYIAESSRIQNDHDYRDDTSTVTPLTSLNSLSNSTLVGYKSTNKDVSERRKSKPVHDMFVPILGKFDELAERLAEIDEML